MSDLELLTSKLTDNGFDYKLDNPINKNIEANLVVTAKTSLTLVHHFYFKDATYLGSDTGSEYIVEFVHKNFEDALNIISHLPPDRDLTPYSSWRHFKGTIVEVITVAKNSETGEELVVYKCTGNNGQTNHTNGVYARPKDMFLSEVDHEKYPDVKTKYRFTKIVNI